MSESTYYIKKGKRYIPVGMSGPNLHNGLWLVQSHSGGTSYKNLYMRVGDLPDCHDLQLLAKVVQLEDTICKTMMKAWEGGAQVSIAEVASRIASAIANAECKLTARNLRGS